MNIKTMLAALQGVAAYKDLLGLPAMECALRLVTRTAHGDGLGALEAYTDLFYQLRQEGYPGLGAWLADALRWSEGPYPRLAERSGSDPALEQAARLDISAFELLASVDCDRWLAALGRLLDSDYQGVLTSLPRWQGGVPFSFGALTEAYRAEGAGLFARYRAFVWDSGQLIPVAHPDCPGNDQLLGYDGQRAEVERNTRTLVEGRYVNNVLLYGESGTGKSATVKNLLTLPGMEELRIIEADKENLGGL
ncbi:MAG: ATP-binding protein, partial [Oscillospiraceae bacterium]|nr:ATP-binding protein [Oscillospiraceae bacterium]